MSTAASSGSVESFIPLNGSAGNSAPVTGGKRKLKLVTRKQARKMLKKLGKKMRGGAENDAVAVPDDLKKAADSTTGTSMGGRRHRGTKKHSRRGRSMFGLKY